MWSSKVIPIGVSSVMKHNGFTLRQQGPLAQGLRLLAVCDPGSLPMRSMTERSYNDLGGYETAGISRKWAMGIPMQGHSGGGYRDNSIGSDIFTDSTGLFIFAVFYKSGSASGIIVKSKGDSSQNDGMATLNSDSTITITANANYTFTSSAIEDGLHTIVFANYRVDGKQYLWIDGLLLDTGSSTAQQGYATNYVSCGENSTGIFYKVMIGVSLGKHAHSFVTEFNKDPWQLFEPRRTQIPVSWNPDPGVQNASIAHGPYPLVTRPSVRQEQIAVQTNQQLSEEAKVGCGVALFYGQPPGKNDSSGWGDRGSTNWGNGAPNGSNLHASFAADAPSTVLTKMGNALYFQGTSNFLHTSGSIGGAVTEVMIAVVQIDSSTGDRVICGNFNQAWALDAYGRGLIIKGGTIRAVGVNASSGKVINSGITPVADEVYIIAARFSATGALAINGKIVGTGDISESWSYSFSVGASCDAYPNITAFFQGKIAAVYQARRHMSDAQLQHVTSSLENLYGALLEPVSKIQPFPGPRRKLM